METILNTLKAGLDFEVGFHRFIVYGDDRPNRRTMANPDCTSDGEALESMIFRASTSPQGRQLITQAALKEPLYAAAQCAWEADHAKPSTS
jgi:hypothetical protein